jgi:signal transduction histidine kinase
MFGIPLETYSGHIDDFRRRIHPEDQELARKAVGDARDERKAFATEFRVIREDGTVRWIAARGKFYYATNGDAERMLGMAADITERKMAEETLTSLSGRLIESQEEERRRIAREIHDDYQQRLAILANELEAMAGDTLDSPSKASERLHELCNRANELAVDLHSLSHRLHSSTLEHLGLVAGLRAFCREFAEQQGLQVGFAHENVPHTIPVGVALCLFRVAQEGIRNVKRHSAANSAEVRLEESGDTLHLSISDRGRGFDSNAASKSGGIGIRSMEERLRLLGGRLEIHSRPLEGTSVDAWLPLKIARQRLDIGA